MLGRGVKRKWSCLAELEAEALPGAGVGAGATEDKKASGEEDQQGPASRSYVSRLQQRQLVLGLCLQKLQHYQAGVELSLRRSVLLINTLRQIQDDMRSDGTGACPPDSCLLRGEDVSLTCPGCGQVGEDQPSSPEFPEFPSAECPPTPTSTTFSDAGSAAGYLSDLAPDDIFEDIDTSMYETSELPSAWTAGSLWPVSVAFWPDEDLKPRAPGHSPAAGLQSCLLDLNELDHIMEVLVKS
ncbi:SERTA domain-containing protein 2 [Cololabis saira]|uniref:SERTA domain-containing protein 2 n=1 Tax=Cololabis saira TaxID=129043 RepID=UPI002AD3843F|nr:SERTA domain-containing protein 2 [Cololabis saira]